MIAATVHYGMTVPPSGQAPEAGPQSFAITTASKARILIVEDDYLVGMAIEETLLQAGHDVIALVTTGEEAVEKGTKLRPDLALMDIRLGGKMTGIEAAIALRAAGIPSLFASAHSDPGTRSSGEEAEPLGWLAKPFTFAGLRSAVDTALASLG
ncbi:response regulator [Novosphingobium sp. RD2P27]|uniref:Response regulator n=1 Tax=Novosphingobium kalidii TaxID=3230299 RepID=A0ABV2D1T3_9SPHN